METALNNRQGSVVWQCIKYLETPLSVTERERMFTFAFDHDMWQALKPLVEAKDETGIAHRDVAFLTALEHNLWDVVDYCQLHHADINAKDENGATPLHRAAAATNWEAVKEIVSRDGDPNLLDRHGCSVLNKSLDSYSSGSIARKALVEYHADIHQPAKKSPSQNGYQETLTGRKKKTKRLYSCSSNVVTVMSSATHYCGALTNGKGLVRKEKTLYTLCRRLTAETVCTT